MPQQIDTYSSSGTTNWVVPAGVYSVQVELWGGGGAGGGASVNNDGGGGGAGGQYVKSQVAVTPGTTYAIVVAATKAGTTGDGTAGNDSTFNSTTVVAKGGAPGLANNGAGGTGSTTSGVGDTVNAGGNGAAGVGSSLSGGGGGGAGTTGNGGNASGSTGGTGKTLNGGNGANGLAAGANANGNAGSTAGGGGSGGYRTTTTSRSGGTGAIGRAVVTYNFPTLNLGGRPTVPVINWNHPLTKNLVQAFDFWENGGVAPVELVQRQVGAFTNSPAYSKSAGGSSILFPSSYTGIITFPELVPQYDSGKITSVEYIIQLASYVSGSFQNIADILGDNNNTNLTAVWGMGSFNDATQQGKLNIDFFNGGDQTAKSTSQLALNQYYHCIITTDGSNANFYINGILDSSPAFTTTPGTQQANSWFVGGQGNGARAINGKLLYLRRWNNRALNKAEVASLYANPWQIYYNNRSVFGNITTFIKTINGLAKASVKTITGLGIGSVKSIDGLT